MKFALLLVVVALIAVAYVSADENTEDRFYDMVDRVDRAIRNRRQSVNGNQKFDLDFEKLINLVKSMQSEG